MVEWWDEGAARVKRIAIKLVVFLLLGAVANVGVAWGCAVWSAADHWRGSLDRTRSDALWKKAQALRISQDLWTPQTGDASSRWTGPGITETWIGSDHLVRSEDPPGLRIYFGDSVFRRVVRLDYGWPARCLHRTDTLEQGMQQVDSVASGEFVLFDYWVVLPTRPIWLGFIINTLFYCMVLWLLWSAPFVTRRLIRRRRGRCVQCGYDLRGAEPDVCPECGSDRRGGRRQ